MAHKITETMLLEAIQNSQGLISKIQKNLEKQMGEKISWDAVKRHLDKYKSCAEAIQAEKEAILDLAENNIFQALNAKDLATAKWYLRMKGKDRGYVETQEVINHSDPLNIDLGGSKQTASELLESSNVEVGNEESPAE